MATRYTILAVDDDEAILRLVTRALDGWCEVLQARTGTEALEVFRLQGDAVDLVLLDLGMPGLSGYEALAELQLIDPDVKVAVITGLEPDEERLPGVRRILTKPFRIDALAAAVRELLAE